MTKRLRRHLNPRAFLVSLSTLVVGGYLAACSSDGAGSPQYDGEGFVSDSPEATRNNGGNSSGSGSGGSGGAAGGAGQPPGEDADRTIVEADIVQVRGDRLFALSRYAGLSVIDLSDPAQLRLVGRYPMTGVPFEMYLEGDVVYAMFSSFGHYDVDDQGDDTWVQSSHIAAIDTRDPANPTLAGEFDLPGEISDSRIVGDVLYAVTYEGGGCWHCASGANTTVTSLAVGDLTNVRVIDQLRYDAPNDSYGAWWRRSVTVTPQRMYVAGVEYATGSGGLGDAHSVIRVVDIGDPGGKLVQGAEVEAAGQIESRWQMDEHEGVLRVISQPGVWATDQPPMLQTFRVESSQVVTPIASKPMILPRPENLRSVRFDGTRAFAITFERTDPLFALDFSDPADPKQLGELEIPGWVYHMEPRGDRLYALGFDDANPEGALNVSLFDVADLTAPRLIERVNFGGSWGSFAEDQDRIHKAFSILPEQGLILVPFSGWTQSQGSDSCSGSYQSGIQLVDFTGDDLALRGVAPQKGEARRALLHNGLLYAVSDERVRSFSIADRSQPAPVGDLVLAHNVNRTALVGDKLVRFSIDWWTNENRLEIVSASDPEAKTPLGTLDLAALEPGGPGSCNPGAFAYYAQIFANGDLIYLTWGEPYLRPGESRVPGQRVAVVSVADPTRPVVVGKAALPIGGDAIPYYYAGSYGHDGALVRSGESVVALGTTLAFQTVTRFQDETGPARSRLAFVDLSDPTAPQLAGSLDLAEGRHVTGLVARGTTLYTSHAEPVVDAPGKVRFFVDRVDVSNPAAPRLLAPINTPGSLLVSEDPRLVTVDYTRRIVPNSGSNTCRTEGYDVTYYDQSTDQCIRIERTFRLLEIAGDRANALDSVPFSTSGYVNEVFVGDDRVFATTGPNYYGGWYYDGAPIDSASENESGILTLGGIREGDFRSSFTPVSSPDPWWSSARGQAVTGQRLVLTDYSSEPHIAVFDATNLDAPTFHEKAKLRGYLSDVEIVGDAAICSLGQFGVQSVSLAP